MIKTNKMSKILIIAMVAMMLVSIVTVSVSASNIDSPFIFSFGGNMQRTNYALKEDDTSMYMYCQYASTAYVAASYAVNDDAYPVASYTHPDGTTYMYLFNTECKRYMYNYVYEEGYDMCCIQASAAVIGSAEGLWSADSVYENGVLSPEDYIK